MVKTLPVFDRYNFTSERDLADTSRKIEISYRQAKIEQVEQVDENSQAVQNETIQ